MAVFIIRLDLFWYVGTPLDPLRLQYGTVLQTKQSSSLIDQIQILITIRRGWVKDPFCYYLNRTGTLNTRAISRIVKLPVKCVLRRVPRLKSRTVTGALTTRYCTVAGTASLSVNLQHTTVYTVLRSIFGDDAVGTVLRIEAKLAFKPNARI